MNKIFRYVQSAVFPLLPSTRFFGLKRWLLRRAGAKIGKNVRICSSASFFGSGLLEIGDNTWIGHRCVIVASSYIKIGANCDLAPNVYIGNGTHEITPKSYRIADKEISKDVIIGNGCWICVNSTILPGVVIPEKCVIAAGAVVSKSISESMSLVAGVPATVKKKLG